MPLISHSSLSKPLRQILIDKTRSKAGGGRLRLYLNWRATMYDWDAWKCHGTCLTSGSMYVAAAVATKRKRPTMLYLVFYPWNILPSTFVKNAEQFSSLYFHWIFVTWIAIFYSVQTNCTSTCNARHLLHIFTKILNKRPTFCGRWFVTEIIEKE